MSRGHGHWLRRERQMRGWSISQMARKLREAAMAADDMLPDHASLTGMIQRWEKDSGGISERYRLRYCQAFRIPPEHFAASATLHTPEAAPIAPASTATAAAPAFHQHDPVYRAWLAADLQPAIRAACADIMRGILTDIIGHLDGHPLTGISDMQAPNGNRPPRHSDGAARQQPAM